MTTWFLPWDLTPGRPFCVQLTSNKPPAVDIVSTASSRWMCKKPFCCVQVDPATGEIAGVFESIQPSDTDLGSKAPKDVKITGLWYGQLS